MDYINFAMSMNAMMRAEEISMRWIGQLETSITKQGVNAGVLKLAVAIMELTWNRSQLAAPNATGSDQ